MVLNFPKNMCFSSHSSHTSNAINMSLNIYVQCVVSCDWVVRLLTSRLYVPKVLNFWLLARVFAFIFVKSSVIEFRKVGTIYGQTKCITQRLSLSLKRNSSPHFAATPKSVQGSLNSNQTKTQGNVI